ncbi:substrate-binding periplasmic protein [Oceanospirillum beijerinckii]|uniref:substrate-binding periplasmic protein n=1 Tax=Oceanospirillum beijerinckii TaxID=64976 RepID=UPI0012FEFE59|nr:transporter substrate-binding domain-containing protein [Oceanospirillum beijerinckii]
MLRKHLNQVSLVVLLLTQSLAALAQTSTLNVGILESANMGFLDQFQQPTGFEVELAQGICLRLKRNCEIKLQSFSQNLQDIQDEKVDFALSSIMVTEERSKHLLFSDHYMSSFSIFVGLPEQPKYRQVKVAVVKGSVQEKYLRQHKADTMVAISYAHLNETYQALLGQEVDQVLGPAILQLGFLSQHPDKEYELLGEPIRQFNLGGKVAVALPLKQFELQQQINDILSEMLTDGSYNQLNKKYFPFSVY